MEKKGIKKKRKSKLKFQEPEVVMDFGYSKIVYNGSLFFVEENYSFEPPLKKIKADVFFTEEDGKGRICEGCGKPIIGKAILPVLQMSIGIIEDTTFSEIDFVFCSNCLTKTK